MLIAGIFFIAVISKAQTNWSLKTNKDGVRIFTKTIPQSGLKAIRVQCALDATLTQMAALVLDVNAGKDWVYGTKSSLLLKAVSPAELYYYSEVKLPWPLSNRDFISHLVAAQDAATKVVTIIGPTIPDYLPEKKDIVRVQHSCGKWTLSPAGNHRINIDYELEADPGGSLPVWLINLFGTSGPLETFRQLKVQVQKPAYIKARLPFIVD